MTEDPRVKLARDYVAAYDALQGEDHQEDQSKLRELDEERIILNARIGAREARYEMAGNALRQHDLQVHVAPEPPKTRDYMREHDEAELGPKASYDAALFEDDIRPIPTEEDEFASAKAAGALS